MKLIAIGMKTLDDLLKRFQEHVGDRTALTHERRADIAGELADLETYAARAPLRTKTSLGPLDAILSEWAR